MSESPAMPTYLGMPPFPEAAATALADSQLRHNLAHATGTIRAKRARAVAELSDWPDLRATAKTSTTVECPSEKKNPTPRGFLPFCSK